MRPVPRDSKIPGTEETTHNVEAETPAAMDGLCNPSNEAVSRLVGGINAGERHNCVYLIFGSVENRCGDPVNKHLKPI